MNWLIRIWMDRIGDAVERRLEMYYYIKTISRNNFIRLAFVALTLFAACARKPSESHERNSPLHIDETSLKEGDVIQPFAYIDPGQHEWKVEIRISGEDLLDIGTRKKMTSRKFWTTDKKVLNAIRNWKFVYGRKSVHKASSTMRVYRDNQMIDKHGIVLERHTLGFQSEKYGMLIPVDDNLLFGTIDDMNHF